MLVQVPLFCNRNTNIILTTSDPPFNKHTKNTKESNKYFAKMKKNVTVEKVNETLFPIALFCVYVYEFKKG